jgi:hypothetical protein
MAVSEWTLTIGAVLVARLVLGVGLRPQALWLKAERAALMGALERGPQLAPEIVAVRGAEP